MPQTVHRNDWIYDYEFHNSMPRKKPQILRATDFTHYRFVQCGEKRVYTLQGVTQQNAKPNTGAQMCMEACRDAYPASLVSNRLLEKIKDQTWSAVVDLAELPETLRFLRGAVSTMYKIYRDLRRGRFRSLRKGKDLDTWAEFWLAWRYAVLPLVYSVQSAVAWSQEPEEVIGKARLAKTHVKVDFSYQAPGGAQWHLSGKLRGVVAYRVTGSRDTAKLGFDLAELPAVLWEVTPLSFVLDWIIPIGDALAGLSATNNVEFLDGYTSLRFKRKTCTWPDALMTGIGNETIVVRRQASASRSDVDFYTRQALRGFPKPTLRVDPNMNLKRWVDALALLKLIVFKGMR